jgi:uncharacterized protein (UPF0264 family)
MNGRLYTSPMQLLVSVRDAHEAQAALEGGADIIDAKEPRAGALGRVELPVFAEIVTRVAARRPVSAALGDVRVEEATGLDAEAFVRAGATLVKLGFAGIADESKVASLIAAANAGATPAGGGVVAVAYADYTDLAAASPDAIVRAARQAGARGVLLDTAIKDGRSLRSLVSAQVLEHWVRHAQSEGLLVALAGSLTIDDIPHVATVGADIAGVRGAACEHGREGQVSAAKVWVLRAALQDQRHHRTAREDQDAASDGSRHPRAPVQSHLQP